MTNSDRKIRPIYGHTLRQLIETKNPDISYMYLYLMFTEDESHTVSLEKLKSPYGGIEWEAKRIDRAIEELIAMNLVAYGFDEDLETGEMIENRNELFLSEMVDTQSEVIARMHKWVFGADIQNDAERMEREDYDDEFRTLDEKKAIENENRIMFENLLLELNSYRPYLFEFDLNEKVVSFAPVDEIGCGHLMRSAEYMRSMHIGECGKSFPIALMRLLIHFSDDDTVLVIYDGDEIGCCQNDFPYSQLEIFKNPDGERIFDVQCKYIAGVNKETAAQLDSIDEESIDGFTYIRGLLGD